MTPKIPASKSNPGYDVDGYPLTNPSVVGHNNAETKINFSPVANSWPDSYNIPGADLPLYTFDGDSGSIKIKSNIDNKESTFLVQNE
jgi:hypothetical protein